MIKCEAGLSSSYCLSEQKFFLFRRMVYLHHASHIPSGRGHIWRGIVNTICPTNLMSVFLKKIFSFVETRVLTSHPS